MSANNLENSPTSNVSLASSGDPPGCILLYVLSSHSINILSQHIPSTHPINHPINTPYQQSLNTHATLFQYALSTYPINTPSQHPLTHPSPNLSTPPINPPSNISTHPPSTHPINPPSQPTLALGSARDRVGRIKLQSPPVNLSEVSSTRP